MTPKEKAKELVTDMQVERDAEKRCYYFHMSLESAKRSAIIAVDEIFEALDEHHWQNRNVTEYYREVKQEIEKL